MNSPWQFGTFNLQVMATSDVTPTQRRASRLRRQVATLVVLSATALCALALADTARAGGSGPSPDPLAGLPDAASTAEQAATAAAVPQDTSTGDTTPQAPADPGSALEAATQQAATAVANASQNNVQNIVVIIRVNSPGDDFVNQANNAIATAVASNDASTNQGTGSGGQDGDSAKPQPDPPTSPATPPAAMPAQVEPPAAAPPASTAPPAVKLAKLGTERARPHIAAVQRPSGDRSSASRGSAVAAESAASRAAAGGSDRGDDPRPPAAQHEAATGVQRLAGASSADKRRTSVTWAPVRAVRAATRAGAGAAHVVGNFSRVPSLPTVSAEKADQVSTAVLLSLFAVLLVLLLGVGSSYVPSVRAWAGR